MTVGPRLRRLLAALAGLAALALATVPAIVAFGAGWMALGWDADRGDIGGLVDHNSPEAWALLAVAFLVWAPLVLVALVVALDRLGQRYMPLERAPRATKDERRRLWAGLRYLAGREAPTAPKERSAPHGDGEGRA